MTHPLINTTEYKNWFVSLKDKVQAAQIKAAIKVNTDLLLLYWELGKQIIEKQQTTSWGDALIPQLAKDLASAFPGSKGFSKRNLFYIRKWVLFFSSSSGSLQTVKGFETDINQQDGNPNKFVPQLVAQLPWGHNRMIIDKCETMEQALFYVQHTIKNNWSRAVLTHQIESKLHRRKEVIFFRICFIR